MVTGGMDQWPYTFPASPPLSPAGQAVSDWGLAVDAPLTLADPDAHDWAGAADLLVAGLGGAGVAAALEALEQGLSVIALDRYEGGGSSAANGGVFYAGGGTSVQREAGVDDTAENMFAYLKLETANIVSDATLRDFCETSPATVEWMRGHGVPFEGSLFTGKTSYPPLDKFLYHPDSSLSAPYRDVAKPAARGHRGVGRNGKLAWGLGKFIFNPLRDAAHARGLVLHRHAEVKQLALDTMGRVIGVRVERITDPVQSARFAELTARADKWFALLPPTLPGAQLSYGRGYKLMAKAMEIEAKHRVSQWYRAKKGVVLSGGGFIVNKAMVSALAPKYRDALPNGTLGDTGSGIMLGVSAGAATALMERVSGWRFLNPPLAWSQAMLVNGRGARYVNETLYGAAIGDKMVEENEGRGYIILDAAARKAALKQAFGKDVLGFQRDITLFNCLIAATKARTLDALAAKLGMDAPTLRQTVADYNRAARGEMPDPFHKAPEEMAEMATALIMPLMRRWTARPSRSPA
jgi:3-oxo-5alpha-steroid 4-dehydrogenase